MLATSNKEKKDTKSGTKKARRITLTPKETKGLLDKLVLPKT